MHIPHTCNYSTWCSLYSYAYIAKQRIRYDFLNRTVFCRIPAQMKYLLGPKINSNIIVGLYFLSLV